MAMIDTERYAQELSKLRETVEKAADARIFRSWRKN